MLPNLKLLRREYGLSQQKLADAVGTSQQSINQYENHYIEPDIEMLSKIADYFETSIDYLVGHSTVRRRIEKTNAFYLDRDESNLIKNYRAMTQKERACVQQIVEIFIEK